MQLAAEEDLIVKKISVVSLLILAMLLTVSCDSAGDPLDKNPVDPAETGPAYTNEDLRADLGIHITFPPLIEEETEKLGEDKPPLETEPVGNPDSGEDENVFLNPHSISQSYNTYGEYKMKVFRQLEIYSSMEDKHPQTVLDDGTSIVVQEIEGNSGWLKVSFEVAPFTGYAKAGFINAVAENLELETYRGVSVGSQLSAAVPEGTTLSYQITTEPSKGSVTVEENGHFVYTPDEGRRGRDYFGYKAFDEAGISYVKTDVGDKYVYEAMQANDYCLGGEESGHIIFSKFASTGDGLITALKIMEVLI